MRTLQRTVQLQVKAQADGGSSANSQRDEREEDDVVKAVAPRSQQLEQRKGLFVQRRAGVGLREQRHRRLHVTRICNIVSRHTNEWRHMERIAKYQE